MSEFEQLTGRKVKKPELYHLALRHSSLSGKRTKLDNNERLEFLGDSVLNACASVFLYMKYPNEREGNLSKVRSFLVNTHTLASLAKDIHLDRYILMSKGAELSGGRNNENILASAFEAVVGALFLEQGWNAVEDFLTSMFETIINGIQKIDEVVDHKSRLQEMSQSMFKTKPVYVLIKEEGPEHAKKFTVKVEINGVEYGTGTGRSKKEAQQKAAKEALKKLESVDETGS